MLIFLGAALMQLALSVSLEWTGVQHDVEISYSLFSYEKAFIIIPIAYVLAILFVLFVLKETHRKR